jgi:uncharacterized membrane protein YfbV (UPF0208 family)
MAKDKGSYGYIVVTRSDGTYDPSKTLKMTFKNRRTYEDTLYAIDRTPGIAITDSSWGLTIYNTPEAAVEDALFWCGKLPKAA